MKQTIAIAAMMATMILFGSSVVYAGCNDLTVIVNSNEWKVDGNNISCTHGNIEFTADTSVIMTNSKLHGPDCSISFLNSKEEKQAIVDFQQNLCVMEAGDITVTSISGPKPNYTITEGSYSKGKGGKVTINGFK